MIAIGHVTFTAVYIFKMSYLFWRARFYFTWSWNQFNTCSRTDQESPSVLKNPNEILRFFMVAREFIFFFFLL